uniref:Uncharacterized protein n=1 Tax=Saimiri boliviensis boliviensis TaxID=39432 RepID=A0A2K6UFB7_SAIBB
MSHQANSKELFRLCSLDPKMSSVVWLTNRISLENMQKGISAIHDDSVCFTLFPHPVSPCPCLQWKWLM